MLHNDQTEKNLMDLVQKALSVDSTTGTSIAPFIKQDLEEEAYVQLYSEQDPAQLSLLKDIPRQEANQVNHEFGVIDSYGNHKAKASFAPNALPPEANFSGAKKSVILKCYGKTSAVQGLTALQNTIRAAGQANLPETNDALVRLMLLYTLNTALYAEDTRDTLDSNQFKGIFQQIDEATKGVSTAKFANNDIFIDLRGQPLRPNGNKGIRQQAAFMGKRNGSLRRIYMAPEVLEQLEEQVDPSARHLIAGNMPGANTKSMVIGSSVDGMRVQGNIVYFRRDAALSTMVRCGYPNAVAIPGAPAQMGFAAKPTAGQCAQPAVDNAGTGKFATTGERLTGIYYVVCAVNEVGESIASAASDPVDAVAGKTIEFDIHPRGDEVSFRVYRGYVSDPAQTDSFLEPIYREAQFVGEIPNGLTKGNTTPITFVDDDQFIPGCSLAWGTDLWSPNAAAIDRGETPSSSTNAYTYGRSSVALATLTGMFEFDLAKLGWLHSNKLFAQVLAPQCPRPYVNVVWYNVGGIENKKSLI